MISKKSVFTVLSCFVFLSSNTFAATPNDKALLNNISSSKMVANNVLSNNTSVRTAPINGYPATSIWWKQVDLNKKQTELVISTLMKDSLKSAGNNKQKADLLFSEKLKSFYPNSSSIIGADGVLVEGVLVSGSTKNNFTTGGLITSIEFQDGLVKRTFFFKPYTRYVLSGNDFEITVSIDPVNPIASYFLSASIASIDEIARLTYLKKKDQSGVSVFGGTSVSIKSPLAIIMNDVYKSKISQTGISMDMFCDQILTSSKMIEYVLLEANSSYADGSSVVAPKKDDDTSFLAPITNKMNFNSDSSLFNVMKPIIMFVGVCIFIAYVSIVIKKKKKMKSDEKSLESGSDGKCKYSAIEQSFLNVLEKLFIEENFDISKKTIVQLVKPDVDTKDKTFWKKFNNFKTIPINFVITDKASGEIVFVVIIDMPADKKQIENAGYIDELLKLENLDIIHLPLKGSYDVDILKQIFYPGSC